MVAETKTVLVTGGSGFLGGWCIAELLLRGYRVRTTMRDLSRETEIRAGVETQVGTGDRLECFAADLGVDEGWSRAVEGCDYVLHVASPFPPTQPKDPDELIVPARDGTLRVLRTSLDAGIDRVVITSSVAAVGGSVSHSSVPLTEEDWTDPDNPKLTPYTRSKTIAERAAWDLVKERDESERLAVVNPGAILGPLLSGSRSFSLELIERLLKGMPGTPRLGYSIVDVRDVADLQIKAMTSTEAGGERFIAVGEFRWMSEVATVLRERLGATAPKVPKRSVPDLVVRGMAIFDPSIRSIVGQLGRKVEMSSEKARSLLGWSPLPTDETIVDCAQSMLDEGVSTTA
jgi:dihydroflavonol-4-reductase